MNKKKKEAQQAELVPALPVVSPATVTPGKPAPVYSVEHWLKQCTPKPWTGEQLRFLQAPLDPDIVDMKPTGQPYINHVHYRQAFDALFGRGGWEVKPWDFFVGGEGFKHDVGTVLNREYVLVTSEGRMIGPVVGHCQYIEDNPSMAWADAAEGAESNAISRLGKKIGLWLELYDRRFVQRFAEEYCIQVGVKGRNTPQWRRKDQAPLWGETTDADSTTTVFEGLPPVNAVEANTAKTAEGASVKNNSKDNAERYNVPGCISYKQASMFFAVAREHETYNQIAGMLKSCGLAGTFEIHRDALDYWLCWARKELGTLDLFDKLKEGGWLGLQPNLPDKDIGI